MGEQLISIADWILGDISVNLIGSPDHWISVRDVLSSFLIVKLWNLEFYLFVSPVTYLRLVVLTFPYVSILRLLSKAGLLK